MKKKVVLFYPTPGIEMFFWFPFPYLYMAPFLQRAGYDPVIIDARADSNWRETLVTESINAVAVGITAMSGPDLLNALEAAKIVREKASDTPICWGGHHVIQFPEHPLAEQLGDYVFLGQAEHSFPEALAYIRDGKQPSGVKGVIYVNNGLIVGDRTSRSAQFDYDIFPAWELIDIEKYRSPNNIASYFSARGCPFKCTFCTTGDFSYSYRTIDQVESELAHLTSDLGFKNIFLQDGTFFLSRKRVMNVARIFHNLGNVKWKAKAKATSLLKYSSEDLKFLWDSGLRSIFFGIESGSQRVLDRMQKKITIQNTLDSAKICSEYGFEFYGSFMFATPGEDVSDLHQTIGVMKEIVNLAPAANLQNCIYLPLPGTPMYQDAVARGFVPPSTMTGWGSRNVSSRFEQREDVVWMDKQTLNEYVQVYNDEFPNYRFAFEKERDNDYTSPLNAREDTDTGNTGKISADIT